MKDETLRRPRPDRRRLRRSPRRVAVRALLGCLTAGPVVGLLWWLLVPGGLRTPGDTYLDVLQAAGASDAAFAVACMAGGAVAGIWWVLARGEEHDAPAVGRLVGLLVGGLLAAVLAWCTGAALHLLVPVEAADVPADVLSRLTAPRPNLAVAAGVLLWPLATGVLVLVDTLRDVVWQALREDRER